ncbi:hypothetical protein D1007_56333 [Hordeum vulgare]|nr:hypothetical protein D1007_56333 [Hordeum vulgare]
MWPCRLYVPDYPLFTSADVDNEPPGEYTTVKPLADRVFLKTKTAEQKTTGGILLPSTAQSKPQSGEVVAVGEGRTIGDSKVQVGIKPCLHPPRSNMHVSMMYIVFAELFVVVNTEVVIFDILPNFKMSVLPFIQVKPGYRYSKKG